MGITESILRSQGNIDNLTNAIGDVVRKKRAEENAKLLRNRLTKVVRPRSIQEQVANTIPPPLTPGADLINEPKGLEEMSVEDVSSISDILRQSPELAGEVNLMGEAAAARKPSMFELGAGQSKYQYNPINKKVELIAENPKEFQTKEPERLKLIRGGKQVYDTWQPGDRFYEKPDRKLPKRFLRSEEVEDGGVKKKVDLYGYTDEAGEHITEKKYIDLTPKGKSPEETDRVADYKRVKDLTDKNEGISEKLVLMQQAVGKSGEPLYSPDALEKVKENIEQNQDEIARIHLKHGGKYMTLRVAREYYKSIDPNAPELSLDDATLKAELEKAGYQIGGPGVEGQ